MQMHDSRHIGNYDPMLNGREEEYIADALHSGWISYGGRYVKDFEDSLSDRFGCQDAISVTSGTCALQLAFELLGEPGSEVLMPALTFAAPASAAVRARMHPIFVDLNSETWQLDDELVEKFLLRHCIFRDGRVVNSASGRPVSAICVVHLWGSLARLDRIHEIARRWNLVVIHDAAQCLGALYGGQPLGSTIQSDQAERIVFTTSFNANKIVTTGAGGALLANSEALIRRVRHIASTAKSDTFDFFHDDYGLNYRLSNVNAAIGLAQMELLDEKLARKRQQHELYIERISNCIKGARFAIESRLAHGNCWMTCVVLPTVSRAVIKRLQGEQIMARPVWVPLPQLPVYSHFQCFEQGAIYQCLHERALMLPSGPGLTDTQMCRVVAALREACA